MYIEVSLAGIRFQRLLLSDAGVKPPRMCQAISGLLEILYHPYGFTVLTISVDVKKS